MLKKEKNLNAVTVGSELEKLTDFFSKCKDHHWNVSNAYVNKIYHLGFESLSYTLDSMVEGRECNILYMLPHVYKADWKKLKKLPYIADLAKRTNLKEQKDELVNLINESKFVYRDEVNIIGPVKLEDKRNNDKYNLLFVQLPYVHEDVKEIIAARKLYRSTNDLNKAMNWSNYTDVFKHYIINTDFSAGQAIRAYLMTITLSAAVKYGMLEVVIPNCEYVWRLIEDDITNSDSNKSDDVISSGWKNALDYAVASCTDINKGLMDIHVVDLDDTSDYASMFNYDIDAVYPAPVKFEFSKAKKTSSKIISDEPKKTEALDDIKVTVNKDTLDEAIEKAAEKKNLD